MQLGDGTPGRRVIPNDADPFHVSEPIDACSIYRAHVKRVDGLRGITFSDDPDSNDPLT